MNHRMFYDQHHDQVQIKIKSWALGPILAGFFSLLLFHFRIIFHLLGKIPYQI